MTDFKYFDIKQLTQENIGQNIYLRGRIHKIKLTGKMCFLILRYQLHTLQCIAFKKNTGEDNFKKFKNLTIESIVDIYGRLQESPVKIKATSYHSFEMEISDINVVSLSNKLPFQIDDANDLGESFRSDVKNHNKLDNRWIDLRTPFNNCVFKIRSYIIKSFRDFMTQNNFTEINTPKLIGICLYN